MARPNSSSLFSASLVGPALLGALTKLDPRRMIRNPVMFVVEVVAALTTILFARDVLTSGANLAFSGQIILWLWFTLIFANFAEALAEGRGKAQADSLRRTRTEMTAKRLTGSGREVETVPGTSLKVGDVVLVEAGDLIPSDGEVIAGVASVNEAAITGESAPVIRESGGDRSAVTGGTQVLSDEIRVRITAAAGSTFVDRMIALVEGASRQKTPNEIALNILLAGLTLIFLFAVASIPSFASYAGGAIPVIVLVALFVTLIPTTIGALLSAIGIAGMGPAGPVQRPRHVGPRRGGGRRRRYPAPRQDRDHHSGQPASHRVPTRARCLRAPTGRRRPARFAGGRDARGSFHRGAGQGQVRHPRPRHGKPERHLRALHRSNANERRRCRRFLDPQGRGGVDHWPR